jgi:uncharacterized protein DUF3311
MAEPTESPDSGPLAAAARSDHSPWNWLLVIPIVVPLLTPLYNHDAPRLWGFPTFYWLQFAFIILGVATTSVVYRMTRRPRPATVRTASDPAPAGPAASREDDTDE